MTLIMREAVQSAFRTPLCLLFSFTMNLKLLYAKQTKKLFSKKLRGDHELLMEIMRAGGGDQTHRSSQVTFGGSYSSCVTVGFPSLDLRCLSREAFCF